MNHISKISINENALIRGESNKRERDRVITDLLESSNITPIASGIDGPFSLNISVNNNKFIINVEGTGGGVVAAEISLMSLRRVIKDYSIICASYFDAIKNAEPRKVEAIDMGRKATHNEGAEILQEQLGGKLDMDFETARKLFSLVYLLQEK